MSKAFRLIRMLDHTYLYTRYFYFVLTLNIQDDVVTSPFFFSSSRMMSDIWIFYFFTSKK